MLLEAQSKTEVQGINSTSFNIKATSKAFQVLTANLYSHKDRSVTREICANAFDSHIQAGKPNTPFKVTLPTQIEPNFIVQDFGVGLSKEDAVNLFSTIFESTKDNSNTQVGAFGLGSKSPFAITDSFSAVCIKDGHKTHLLIFKGDDGTPNISVVLESTTEEQNGVTISVPIDPLNVNRFVADATLALFPFNPKPQCNLEFSSITDSDVLEFDDFYVCPNKDRTLYSDYMYIQNGPALFDVTSIQQATAKVSEPINLMSIESPAVIILKSSIGDVDLPPSRETLDCTRKTTDYILNKCIDIKNKSDKEIVDYVNANKEPSYIAAIKKLSSLDNLIYNNIFKRYCGDVHRYAVGNNKLFKKEVSKELKLIQRCLDKGALYENNLHIDQFAYGGSLFHGLVKHDIWIIDNIPQTSIKSATITKKYISTAKTKLGDDKSVCFMLTRHLVSPKNNTKHKKAAYTAFKNKHAANLQLLLDRMFDKGNIEIVTLSDIKDYERTLNKPAAVDKKESNIKLHIFMASSTGKGNKGPSHVVMPNVNNATCTNKDFDNYAFVSVGDKHYDDTVFLNNIVAAVFNINVIKVSNKKQQDFVDKFGIKSLESALIPFVKMIEDDYTKFYLLGLFDYGIYSQMSDMIYNKSFTNIHKIAKFTNPNANAHYNYLCDSLRKFFKYSYYDHISMLAPIVNLAALQRKNVSFDGVMLNQLRIKNINGMITAAAALKKCLRVEGLPTDVHNGINKVYNETLESLDKQLGE